MRTLGWILLSGFTLASAASGAAGDDDRRIVHVLNRLTPGATAALVDEVRAKGLEAWLESQWKGACAEPEAFTERVGRLPTLALDRAAVAAQFHKQPDKAAPPEEKARALRQAAIPTREMLAWILCRSLYSANPVREVSADFFRNHFSLTTEKGLVRFLAADWEREVIHRHALGSFPELLLATATHPAMLFYLDNSLSRKPASPAELAAMEARARRRGLDPEEFTPKSQRGLNENYARELLELHTLGVDNGYTQADVASLARCLTGWTFRRHGEAPPEFEFVPRFHCGGDKEFLGGVIPENAKSPGEEGREAIRRILARPECPRFLAWKLCRWLVDDSPPEGLVDRIAAVFRDTQGNLPAVFKAIVHDEEFLAPARFRSKYKRPWEFVVSALRAAGAEVDQPQVIFKALEGMNEPLYRCPDPTGYYDQSEAWRDPGSLAARWTFADDLASGKLRGVRVPARLYEILDPARPETWAKAMALRLLPVAGVSPKTQTLLETLVSSRLQQDPKAGPAKIGPPLVAAILGSPDFQLQ